MQRFRSLCLIIRLENLLLTYQKGKLLLSLLEICQKSNLVYEEFKMTTNNRLFGDAELLSNIVGMPKNGLTTPKIRVELFEKTSPNEAWISELKVCGSLPWLEGQKRRVEVRILSDSFRDYIKLKKPLLQIRYGTQVVGSLTLEEGL